MKVNHRKQKKAAKTVRATISLPDDMMNKAVDRLNGESLSLYVRTLIRKDLEAA